MAVRILFLCTGNSCRSQMAEGFARKWLHGAEIWSAGTHPADRVNPLAVQVMAEKGIDISTQYPKTVSEVPQPVDVVITLCGEAAEECPIFPGTHMTEHWGLPDPARATGSQEEVLQVFRIVRDRIEQHIRNLVERAPTDRCEDQNTLHERTPIRQHRVCPVHTDRWIDQVSAFLYLFHVRWSRN